VIGHPKDVHRVEAVVLIANPGTGVYAWLCGTYLMVKERKFQF
jgi:hypothetical protein